AGWRCAVASLGRKSTDFCRLPAQPQLFGRHFRAAGRGSSRLQIAL
ncbi:MAG: hypothetical protein AVDCRST_MAG23-2724, partial [uncultured Sphingosinicella sp.]